MYVYAWLFHMNEQKALDDFSRTELHFQGHLFLCIKFKNNQIPFF